MKWLCWGLVGLVVVAASVVMIGRSLLGQDRGRVRSRPILIHQQAAAPMPEPGLVAGDDPVVVVGPSVSDALLRPLDLPFGEATTLENVQKYLAGALGAPVVLDLAALDRLDLDPEDRVQLDLKGVRLKTGLKLLLDQVGMTFRVVAEDNLLILTDASEAGEPIDRALHQLKTLHNEMHDLQDAVDDLRDLVEQELGIEPEDNPNKAIFVRATPREPRRDLHRRPGRPRLTTPPRPAGTAG